MSFTIEQKQAILEHDPGLQDAMNAFGMAFQRNLPECNELSEQVDARIAKAANDLGFSNTTQ